LVDCRSSKKPVKTKLKDLQPAVVPEEDEVTEVDPDDETDTTSLRSSYKIEHLIMRDDDLERTLSVGSEDNGIDHDDVKAARRRLLTNELLHCIEGGHTNQEDDEELNTCRSQSPVSTIASMSTERSRLRQASVLPDAGSTFAQMLRPSIFTTVASLARLDDDASHKANE
jgi:hypothetical protein